MPLGILSLSPFIVNACLRILESEAIHSQPNNTEVNFISKKYTTITFGVGESFLP